MAGPAPESAPQPAPAPSRGEPLLLATGNPGKVRELAALMQPLFVRLLTLEEVRITEEVEESGATLEENAALKALTYARLSGLWALADDSGLEVDALGGAPGPLSRRYAGPTASDQEMVSHLLREIKDIPEGQRSAQFRCVIALASPAGELQLYQGRCQGIITQEPHGESGFGYDPVFLLPELARTMAELTLEEKNHVSHRVQAVRALAESLEQKRGNRKG